MKAIAVVAAAVFSSACVAQYEQFPDVPENHWVFQTVLSLRKSGHIEVPNFIFRRTLRSEVAQVVVDAERALDAKLKWIEELAESKTGWREAYDRSQAFAGAYKDIEVLLMMTDVFAKELEALKVDPKTLQRSLAGLRPRNARVQVISLLQDTSVMVKSPQPTDRRFATRNDLAIQLDSLIRSADLTIDQATELLLSIPSFELLSMLTMPPDRFRTMSSSVAALMPRPLSECNVTTVMSAMRQLSDLPTSKLKLVIDECEALSDELLVGNVPSKFAVALGDAEGNIQWSDSLLEIRRKCSLLLKYTFRVPDGEMYPWTYGGAGNLTLVPSPKCVPENFLISDDYPQVAFDKYSKYPRRQS